MGFDGYAILGYRKSKLSSGHIQDLLASLRTTECYTEEWMHWYGTRTAEFDRVLLEYSELAEFVLLIIGEEGNLLEVARYKQGKISKSEFTMLSLEVFTGYSTHSLNKLSDDNYEGWIEAYDAYRKKIQSQTADSLGLFRIDLKAPVENV